MNALVAGAFTVTEDWYAPKAAPAQLPHSIRIAVRSVSGVPSVLVVGLVQWTVSFAASAGPTRASARSTS
jgi:hypothetical protein